MNNRIFRQQHMDNAELHDFCNGQVAVFSRTSPAKSTVNEDSCALIESTDSGHGILVLADGAGGHAAGDRASALAVENLAHSAARSMHDNARITILDAIEHSNTELLSLGTGSATTLIVIELQENRARAYVVGDSTALITGQRGLVKFQSIAQSPVGYAIESGIADESDMRASEDRHFVSNLLGMADMHITIGPWVSLAARDTLLVCSDGLTDNLFVDTIIDTVRKGSLPAAAEQLHIRARQQMQTTGGHADDLTFMLFRLKR